MQIKKCIGLNGGRRDYMIFEKAVPPYPLSDYIEEVVLDKFRYHSGEGDMWPLTWGEDNRIYAGAGDNRGCLMNVWRITDIPENSPGPDPGALTNSGRWMMDMIHGEPVDVETYCKDPDAPYIKPAGILDIGGRLFFSVEAQNYGDNALFNRQRNLHGWIIVSDDYGKSFQVEATPCDFFTGRLSSCHFLQFGRGYRDSRDEYVYAYFPYDRENNCSYWENNDALLLGRVPADSILNRDKWEFYCSDNYKKPLWTADDKKAEPVFVYSKMTGSNHVCYNKGLGRYIMGNYGFVDEEMYPRPVHQMDYPQSHISQLTLFEAEEPWGPWKLFYRDDNWGTYGDYQPNFPVKWISQDGHIMFMVSSGSWDDYNFVVQKIALRCRGEEKFPVEAAKFGYGYDI